MGSDRSLLDQVPAEVTVHRCWTIDLPFAIRKSIKRLLAGKENSGGGAASAARPVHPLKRLLGNLLLPDPQIGWLPLALPAARRIVRTRKIDLVIVTVPPFSTSMLVRGLRKRFVNLPIVLDFRDEWLTTTLNLWSFDNNPRARIVASRVEADAVQSATAVVAVTEAARQELIGRYPEVDSARFHYIPNGFDRTPPTSVPERRTSSAERDQVTLTYIGSVYASTAPDTFVEAVLGLSASQRSRLLVRFIGHVETTAYRDVLLRLGDILDLKGFVPQAKALRAIEDTDFLLLITHDRINVAAKFYDYLGGGKPIVAAIHPDGDVRKLLEETRAGRWADVRDPAAIRQMLISLLEPDTALNVEPEWRRIADFHRKELAHRYALLCQELKVPD